MDYSRDPEFATLPTRKCPHLGLLDDLKTWSATEQMQNYCHFRKRPHPVEWAHQCEYCFSDTYPACPILNHETPRSASIFKTLWDPQFRLPLSVLLILMALAVGGYVFWNMGFPPLFLAAVASTEETKSSVLSVPTQTTPTSTRLLVQGTPTPPASRTAALPPTAAAATATMPLTPTPTQPLPSQTPTETVYASPTAGPGLETPFGVQPVYLVHQVAPGEHLEMLARLYGTTEPVLRALNNMRPRDVLYVDISIVVIPGESDVNAVQPRKAVYLYRDSSLQQLADQYSVTVEQLRADNGLGFDDLIPARRWLVVPVTP